jgi:branched-subunit amino acid ABC-type transport system permease component
VILIGQTVVNILLLAGVLTIAALGFAIVWGVMNIINLVHGATIMLGAYVTFILFSAAGIDPFLTIPISMLLMFGLGYVIQRGIINYVMRAPMLVTFLLTFGLEIIIINLALFFFKGDLCAIHRLQRFKLTLFPSGGHNRRSPHISRGAADRPVADVVNTLPSRTRLAAPSADRIDKDAAQPALRRIDLRDHA